MSGITLAAGVFLMGGLFESLLERIRTKNIPDLYSVWEGHSLTLKSQALVFVRLLETLPIGLLWMGIFVLVFRKPALRAWTLAGISGNIFTFFSQTTSPIIAHIVLYCSMLGCYIWETYFAKQTNTRRPNDHKSSTLESCDGDSLAKESASTSASQVPAFFKSPMAVFLCILAMIHFAAHICSMMIDHIEPQSPERESSLLVIIDGGVHVVCVIAEMLTAVYCYVSSTDALISECVCALTIGTACFTWLRLDSYESTWQARMVDGALAFPLMQLGLALGFFANRLWFSSQDFSH